MPHPIQGTKSSVAEGTLDVIDVANIDKRRLTGTEPGPSPPRPLCPLRLSSPRPESD